MSSHNKLEEMAIVNFWKHLVALPLQFCGNPLGYR
jgi:hypothetical protein